MRTAVSATCNALDNRSTHRDVVVPSLAQLWVVLFVPSLALRPSRHACTRWLRPVLLLVILLLRFFALEKAC